MILDIFPSEPALRFRLPDFVESVRIVLAFDLDVGDREFVCLCRFWSGEERTNVRIGGLSYSQTFDSEFTYVPALEVGSAFRTEFFKPPNGVDRVDLEVVSWADKGKPRRPAVRRLALEAKLEPSLSGSGALLGLLPGEAGNNVGGN